MVLSGLYIQTDSRTGKAEVVGRYASFRNKCRWNKNPVTPPPSGHTLNKSRPSGLSQDSGHSCVIQSHSVFSILPSFVGASVLRSVLSELELI